MRRLPTTLLATLTALCCITAALQLSAQLRLKGFRYPFYEEQATNETSRIKGLVTGDRAESQADGLYHVQGMRIELYAADSSTNLIAHAPECLLDQPNASAFSTNTLEIVAANNQLHISGRRFRCNLNDNSLVISNDVRTLILQSLASSTRTSRNLTPATPFPISAATNNPAPTNQIRIASRELHLHSVSNRVIYLGNVTVISEEMDIACQRLTIQFNTNNAVEHIVAETDVSITSRQGGGSAQGQRAVYQTAQNQESLTLHGNPARWLDGSRQGQARRFVFDLTGQTVRAEEDALIQLPKASLNQSNWLLSEPAHPTPTNATTTTNDILQIQSSVVTLHLPTPQQPGRSVFAETNVVIFNASDGTRATGDQASYREDNGTVELIGNAAWESAGRVVRGDLLFFDRTNLLFRATSNAYLGLPLSAIGSTIIPLPATPPPTTTPLPARPPVSRYLEVFAEKYHYEPGALRFENDVWMNLFEANQLAAQLTCKHLHLTLSPSNQVEQITARHDVTFDQFPPPTQTIEVLEQRLRSETLTVLIATNGRVRTVIARQNVVAHKTERKHAQPLPITTTLRAGLVTSQFFAHTNALQSIIAENNVLITQGPRWAQGSRATYWTTNNMIELTGNPIAQAPEGRITDAEVLLWDRNHDRFMVKELRARGDNLPGASNLPFTRPNRP